MPNRRRIQHRRDGHGPPAFLPDPGVWVAHGGGDCRPHHADIGSSGGSFPSSGHPKFWASPRTAGCPGRISRTPGSLTSAGYELNFTVREALRTLDYWLLFFGITLRVLVTVALTIHFIPILVWKGMDEVACAYLVSLFAFGTIITTLLNGWAGDRWDKSLLSSAGIIPMILGMMGLMLSPSPLSLYALPIGLAITMGTVPLNWALIGDFFGRRSYATLRGILGIGTGLGTFLTPIYAGWVFDRTESYFHVLIDLYHHPSRRGFSFILLHTAHRRRGS